MDYTESLLIEFDPLYISYNEILEEWNHMHTPYPSKTQYKSALFYVNNKQKQIAENFWTSDDDSQKKNADYAKWVDIEKCKKFYMAEEYHQNYLQKLRF